MPQRPLQVQALALGRVEDAVDVVERELALAAFTTFAVPGTSAARATACSCPTAIGRERYQ